MSSETLSLPNVGVPPSAPSVAAPNVTVGLDLGDKRSQVYEVAADGTRLVEAVVPTTPRGLASYFAARARCRVVLEVGTHSPWVARALAGWGHEVVVANPSAVYGTRRRRKRNDRLDAEYLARQGRADVQLLHPIQHRSLLAQQDLEVVRGRDQLVRARAKLINHVRGAVKVTGTRVPPCAAEGFARRAAPALPPALTAALTPLLEMIQELTRHIRTHDRQIAAVSAARYPTAARLQVIPGVGPVTALAFVLLIDDPTRFARSRDVGAYFGLVPRLDDTTESHPQLGISKAGDALGRRLLVSAAHYILGPFGPPSDLRRHGEAIALRGGANAKKRAVIAVARKLAVLLHRLWVSGVPYDPAYQTGPRAASTPARVWSPRADHR